MNHKGLPATHASDIPREYSECGCTSKRHQRLLTSELGLSTLVLLGWMLLMSRSRSDAAAADMGLALPGRLVAAVVATGIAAGAAAWAGARRFLGC